MNGDAVDSWSSGKWQISEQTQASAPTSYSWSIPNRENLVGDNVVLTIETVTASSIEAVVASPKISIVRRRHPARPLDKSLTHHKRRPGPESGLFGGGREQRQASLLPLGIQRRILPDLQEIFRLLLGERANRDPVPPPFRPRSRPCWTVPEGPMSSGWSKPPMTYATHG